MAIKDYFNSSVTIITWSGVYMCIGYMNYIETCSFFVTVEQCIHTSNISSTPVRPGWISISKYAGDLREKSSWSLNAEIPIGLDARRNLMIRGGAYKGPPPMGLGLSNLRLIVSSYVFKVYITCFVRESSECQIEGEGPLNILSCKINNRLKAETSPE